MSRPRGKARVRGALHPSPRAQFPASSLACLAPWVLLPASWVASDEPPLAPGRDEARRWAREELSHSDYAQNHVNWLQQALKWLGHKLQRMPSPASPGAALAIGLVIVLAVVLVALLFRRIRTLRGASLGTSRDRVFGTQARTAAEHRAAAEEAAAEEAWSQAVLERFRALVRTLEERTQLSPRPGRTAGEIAREASAGLPDLAAALGAAATVFDAVRYGDHEAGRSEYLAVASLDEQVRRARWHSATFSDQVSATAVPR